MKCVASRDEINNWIWGLCLCWPVAAGLLSYFLYRDFPCGSGKRYNAKDYNSLVAQPKGQYKIKDSDK